jgi:hydrogenase large subunit
MATIKIIDPVTRIEGHMSVEVTIDQNRVVDARCTGTLFRGFEIILNGRDPRDAPIITQRICGVCPISHGMASVNALESAGRLRAPDNGRILRNLTLGANYLQSHILHFYFLAAYDFMKGPATSPWAPAWDVDIRNLSKEPITGNLPRAIEARRRAHEMGAIFSGRMPTTNTFVPGGFTAIPTQQSIDRFRAQLAWLTDFIKNVYILDVLTLGNYYNDYFSIGGGYGNLLAYGAFDLDGGGAQKLFGPGCVEAGKTGKPLSLNLNEISESVSCSWYDESTNDLHPSLGKTTPIYPKTGAYSWLKAPRYYGRPFEAGPLARMWVNGDYQRGISVMDRHIARAYEAQKVAEAMMTWLGQLRPGTASFTNQASPASGTGVGLTEAARGALGHWVSISAGRIARYQVITPTCWNASPRDDQDIRGPMEQALIDTPVIDPERPIEVLRIIHSFDPCLSCAVHVIRPRRQPVVLRAGSALRAGGRTPQC